MMNEVCLIMWSQNNMSSLIVIYLYMDMTRRWKEKMDAEHPDMYDSIKGYEVNNECIEKETMGI